MKPLHDITAFLLDLDGTTYLGGRVLPGAQEFISLLKAQKKRHLYLTNNSSRSAADWARRLRGMGFDADDGQVFTSADATVAYLQRQGGRPKVFPLGTPSFEGELERGGCELVSDDPDFVVLGFDLTLTYEKLRRACLFIRRGVPFIASHPDRVCPTEEGYIPDCGAMAALLTEATGVRPKVLGKPNREMVEGALARLKAQPAEAVMVGDRLYTDIRMGYEAGITTILVLTGEAALDDLHRSEMQPDYIFPSLGHLAEALRLP